ncbi:MULTISPECIES: hypothetical protein [Enterobacteriaceae]|uniref:hypothetical protein n=1 Tax=Enterobacteriaceae TaxID=543 RepID=UPI000469B98F|nr:MULTISPECIES: hypothetical protein [Klebsiella]ELP5713237.1 hypothetical protein [Enterobacter asburiae]EKQ6538732.1 hypothetical protein [Klebsiella michiganensis]ELQ7986706.1 hypothetical protein [Klebsiella michiganensis]MCW9596113.1 hypothetical protein [Klebsiella michiganensis]MDU3810281.1 hypothetical protein [Klebsiella grimontii]
MNFLDRIKKEMSEGIVKAILEHHGYRVIDTGIEKVIREVSCLPQDLYLTLGFPDALRRLPDFVVMDVAQTHKNLVDVKYRSVWDNSLLFDNKILAQLEYYKNIILIVINSNPPAPKTMKSHKATGAYIRCVQLKHENSMNFVKWRGNSHDWVEINNEKLKNFQWFSTHYLWEVFKDIPNTDEGNVIKSSVMALSGIITGLSKS